MRWGLLLSVLLAPCVAAAAQPTLIRSPSAAAGRIAFVAHADLWTAGADGGDAVRLVRSAGAIVAARLSPDGRWVAFTERAHGGQDVYAVPTSGGAPHRLTYDARPKSSENLVVAWTPDSRRVVFLSDRDAWAFKVLRAFSAPVEGGPIQALPLDQAGSLGFSPDGGAVAYTRTFTDLDTRKRYIGGEAEDVFTYDLAARRLTRITDWKGTDTDPMWADRRLYFLSDRGAGFRLNLWSYDLDTKATRQLTRFTDYDVDTPALGGGRILFQQGGRLWAFELKDERLHEIAVNAPDDGARTAPRQVEVGREARTKDVTGAVDYALAPDGLAIVAAHGDLFAVGSPEGARDLTATPAVDEDHPAVSPDGRTLAYVTDADGAQQLAVRPLAGGPERRLTRFASGALYTPVFSPDGRRLAVASAGHELWLASLDGRAPVRVASDPNAEIRDATFSPDGRWLAFSTLRATGLSALHLYDLHDGRDTVVSGPLDGDRLPAFAPDGSALYFVSKRNELPFTTDRGDETTISSLDSDGMYAAALGPGPVEALMARAVRLPVTSGRIVSLETRGAELVYEARPPALIDGELPGVPALHALDVATGRGRVLVPDLERHALSADGRRALFQRDGEWRIADLAPGGGEHALALDGLKLTVDPRAEWGAMFEHAWRLDRDLFFSRVMNGDDWTAVHDRYARLLQRLGSREDFLYLLGQLQGELATSHAFVGGVDAGDASAPVHTPRLGADLQLDAVSGRYRVARIYRGDPTRERFRSPLNTPTLKPGGPAPVREGDYLLAIDGRELQAPTDPDSLLLGHEGEVALTVAPGPEGPRRTLHVSPLADDLDLRQYDWVEANRARVAALSGGRIGYVFMANFAAVGAQDLLRQLQGQLDKDGLVIDIRWNWGGFTSQAVLDVLRRVHAGAFVNREGAVTPLPLFTAPRAMATLVNAVTSSDGDQFAYYFKASGLGSVVGERTWGGVQGIKGPWPLMDGARITIPKDSLASDDGHWLIENAGVTPDIAVSRAPDEVDLGQDSQLDAAVRAVQAELATHPPIHPKAPAPLPAYPQAGEVPGAAASATAPS